MAKRFFILVAGPVLVAFLAGCKPEVTGEPLDNIPPSVRLPNSMADSMTIEATTLVKWIGDDADGIVVGYSYRVDGGRWRHEADADEDWVAADDRNGNGLPDRNWDGGFGLLGIDDDGDNEISAYEDSSRYYGYSIYADEELPNGLDDDGDGRIDEDCWGNDANLDGDCGYDPEEGVDEDPINGVDDDHDGLLDEDPVVRPRWVRAMGLAGEWTFWSSATQDTVHFNATFGVAPPEVHRFEVKCLDNRKAESAPLVLTLFTTTYLPTPAITGGPAEGENVFMSPDTLGAWKGIRYDLGGTDVHRDIYYNIIEDGRVVQWAHWLDDAEYRPPRDRFDANTQAVLFNVSNGWHTLYVQCMDNAGAISDSVVSRRFYASNPTFVRDVLLVDDAYYLMPSYVDEEFMYEGTLLAGKDVSRVVVPDDEPMSLTLQPADVVDFKAIWWVRMANDNDSLLSQHQELLADYLRLGGHLVLEGRRFNKSLAVQLPGSFEEGDYLFDWLGVQSADECSRSQGFEGATPLIAGYPELHLDPGAGLASGLPYTTTLMARESAEAVYAMVSTNTTVNGRSDAIRYVPEGTTGVVLFFGFPFMYLDPADLTPLGLAIMTDLGL